MSVCPSTSLVAQIAQIAQIVEVARCQVGPQALVGGLAQPPLTAPAQRLYVGHQPRLHPLRTSSILSGNLGAEWGFRGSQE